MRFACILLLAWSGGAQSQWADKAFAAYRASPEQLIEGLSEAVLERDAPRYSEPFAYVAALFDAAIQSGITVPANVLIQYDGTEWEEPMIILLARDPNPTDPLLRIREHRLADVEWLAVHNLLLEYDPQRLFALMLGEVSIWHVFLMTDPGETDEVLGGGYGAACGDSIVTMPAGFPPIGLYALSGAMRGDVLLADGPEKSSFHRFEMPSGKQSGYGSCSGSGPEWLRVGYLAALTHLPQKQVENLFHTSSILGRQWEQDLRAQEMAIRAFAQSMPGVSGMKLKIEAKIEDRRKTSKGPMPNLAAREFVLQ